MTEGLLCETQADVAAVAAETGVSLTQQQRWRSAGLLPAVEQRADPRYGSKVEYPSGYSKQLRALARAMRRKRDNRHAGRQLWWQGYQVAECYYRDDLCQTGRHLDRLVELFPRFLERLSGSDSTAGDRLVARPIPSATVTTRIKARLASEDFSAFWNVFADVAVGEFEGYPISDMGEGEHSLREIVERGFDIEGVDSRLVRGQALNLQAMMPLTLASLSQATVRGGFERTAKQSARTLEAARDDARLTLQMAQDMQAALHWIYAGVPTGFRLAAWVGEKLSPRYVPMIVLYFAKLREANALLPSEVIAAMAQQAVQCRALSMQLKKLRGEDAALAGVITPARMRRVLADEREAERFTRELRRIIVPQAG